MADVDGAVGAVAATVANYHEDVADAIADQSRVGIVGAADAVATVANYHEDADGAIATRTDQNA
ncbi:hypothetical protein ACWM35_18505 [Neobacillus sp. K501]